MTTYKYEHLLVTFLAVGIIVLGTIFVPLLICPPKTSFSPTPEPVLAPTEASKQLFGNEEYKVYEFTDPVTYKRYLVFRGIYSLSVVEAPRTVLPLEEK